MRLGEVASQTVRAPVNSDVIVRTCKCKFMLLVMQLSIRLCWTPVNASHEEAQCLLTWGVVVYFSCCPLQMYLDDVIIAALTSFQTNVKQRVDAQVCDG